jgi:AcrR family transcriptional regulator
MYYEENVVPQILKEETRTAILKAALAVFAEKGFRDASMLEVSRRAGLSAGNIYRYYPEKRALYSAAIPPGLMEELSATLDRKISGWQGQPLADESEPVGAEVRFRGELINLLVANRLHWVVLLREGMGEVLTERLTLFFERWLGSLKTGTVLDDTRRMTVRILYRNLINLMSSVLRENREPEELQKALAGCIDYHMAGLKALMEKWRNG